MSVRFVFDSNLCIDCLACVVACKQWHDIPAQSPGYREVHEITEGVFPDAVRRFISTPVKGCDLCRSCGGQPHCAMTCPTRALRFE